MYLLASVVVYQSDCFATGFDTKDTDLSGSRLAWQKLQQTLQKSNRINFHNRPPLYPATEAQNNSSDEVTVTKTRVRRSWADELLNTFNKVPCYDAPIPFSTFN
ncbi:hypothetical protein TELCIR_14989 [Teladorsagia circumcincta]|uniref:Uncharacterized protein n=1 Tax=Teladorsagia circumcincta TaxID=45464 RepID=A0A2G9TZE4_TELCI|nr:hypothetical protein TELCIR_14989 [Teladorsagia circumcincta]